MGEIVVLLSKCLVGAPLMALMTAATLTLITLMFAPDASWQTSPWTYALLGVTWLLFAGFYVADFMLRRSGHTWATRRESSPRIR